MRIYEADILFMDFETTGAYKGNDNLPWQLGCIRMACGELRVAESFSVYLRVPAEHVFNPYAPGRWAAMRKELDEAPRLLELWPQLQPWLCGRVLSAHHVPTERTILGKVFPGGGFGPWLDTLEVVKRAYPRLPSYKLEEIMPLLGLTPRVEELAPGRAPHDAYYDACACGVLMEHILRLPGWHHATVEELATP